MEREFLPMVYLLASRRNGTVYTGATSNLLQRIAQHRAGSFPGFTRNYEVKLLVWFEPHATMESAIVREKRIEEVGEGLEAGADRGGQSGVARPGGGLWVSVAAGVFLMRWVPAFAGMTKKSAADRRLGSNADV